MPNTASASVRPCTWAMPQSSRSMVVAAACRRQRACSAGVAAAARVSAAGAPGAAGTWAASTGVASTGKASRTSAISTGLVMDACMAGSPDFRDADPSMGGAMLAPCERHRSTGMRDTGRPAIPRAVWMLGFVSLFTDMGSEIVHSLLPVLLATTLGASMLTIGLLEGAAEATVLFTKVFSGWASDALGRRKPLVLFGYGLAAVVKPLFPLAGS